MRYRLSLFLLAAVLLATLPPASARSGALLPLGPEQPAPREAYEGLLAHIAQGKRALWAQKPFAANGEAYPAGTVVAPEGIAGDFTSVVISDTVDVRPAYALDGTGMPVGVFGTTVDGAYGTASRELADMRETLENYLGDKLRYQLLDEADLAIDNLRSYAIIVLPAVRASNEREVIEALGPQALARLRTFVRGGGFVYAQGNAAAIAEAAGILPTGTVDLSTTLVLAPGEPLNRGVIAVRDTASPLAFSLITDTLYLQNDPLLKPSGSLKTVAAYTNLDGPDRPAVVTGPVGKGRVILVNGHPTDAAHRPQLPLFMNALLWSMGKPAAISGDAAQTYNAALDPHLLPAYEGGTPISATLMLENFWDTPLASTVVTETVGREFQVLTDTVRPAAVLTALPSGETQIVWRIGNARPGAVKLQFRALTRFDQPRQGFVNLSNGVAAFSFGGETYTVAHGPIQFRASMAARLELDRDIEPDRHFFIPKKGLYLDVAVPIENKEDTAAAQTEIIDVIPLITPMVGLDDQQTILGQNNGQTVWIRNEVHFYQERNGPFVPPDGYLLTDTITLDDWEGDYAVIDVPYGTHGEVTPNPTRPLPRGFGNYVTIPISYTNYLKLTPDHKLLIPVKVLRWTVGAWPGYHYEEPAIRYALRSSELFSRTVTFAGDPGVEPEQVVVRATGGSIYTHLGATPIFHRDYLSSGLVYTPTASVTPMLSYNDLWDRPHTTPLRAAFYDLFSWASCACGDGLGGEQHAGLSVTFQLRADVNGDGLRSEPVQIYPARADGAELEIVLKDRSNGAGVPRNEMLIDMGMFRGLGVEIVPSSGDWATSWQSNAPRARLVAVERELATDHLLFQHAMPPDTTATITLTARIVGNANEGMLKLHQGARVTYRQPSAGPSRYELYDTHVQGVLAAAPRITIDKQVTPVQVNTRGDTLYYLLSLRDPDEPRTLRRNGSGDPFLQSFGFGDIAATTYVGGREGLEILHSVVMPGERTRIRVELNNNSSTTLSGVTLVPQPPPGITITRTYTESVPLPLFPDWPFLYETLIPEAGRGVYYFDVLVAPDYAGPRGQVVEVPFALSGTGIPAGVAIPPARIGIANQKGEARYVSGVATALELQDTLPPYVELTGASLATPAAAKQLLGAASQSEREAIFISLNQPISYSVGTDGVARFSLPPNTLERVYDLAGDGTIRLIARATIAPEQAGANTANAGATVTYTDALGITYTATSGKRMVEAHGANVRVRYACEEVAVEAEFGGEPVPAPECLLEAGKTNRVKLRATVFNAGDYVAKAITTTLTLPPGITLLQPLPANVTLVSDTITWQVGDLAPGAALDIQLRAKLTVTPAGTVPRSLESRMTIPLIVSSDGDYIDALDMRRVQGSIGAGFMLPLRAVLSGASAALTIDYACIGVEGQINSTCELAVGKTNIVMVEARIRNNGDYAARATLAQMQLAPGVTLLDAEPLATVEAGSVGWNLQDVAATTTVTVWMRLAIDVPGEQAGGQYLIISAAEGQYTDSRTATRQRGPLGSSYLLPVGMPSVAPIVHQIFAPITSYQLPPRQAELRVVSFTIDPAQPIAGEPVIVTAVVENTGNAPAAEFWVDLYLDPPTAPITAGQPWNVLCSQLTCEGVAWLVPSLAAGEQVTLTTTNGFGSRESRWSGKLASGPHTFYVYTDSWNGQNNTTGSIEERDETNNRAAQRVSVSPGR